MSGKFRYRSLAGDVYDAEVLLRAGAGQESCCNIEAIFPNGRRVELKAIPLLDKDNGARGVCFNREDPDAQT